MCSRQESNLELRYRKPKFYPLNYESKRVVKRKLAFFCTASAALDFEALAEEDSRAMGYYHRKCAKSPPYRGSTPCRYFCSQAHKIAGRALRNGSHPISHLKIQIIQVFLRKEARVVVLREAVAPEYFRCHLCVLVESVGLKAELIFDVSE